MWKLHRRHFLDDKLAWLLVVRRLVIVLVFYAAVFMPHSADAYVWDSGWLDFSCVNSHNMWWVPACAVTEGPRGAANAQWFTARVYANMPFAAGDCRISLRTYYGGWLRWEPNEDFVFSLNGRAVTIYDRNNYSSPGAPMIVALPGTFRVHRGWNTFDLSGRGGAPWAKSVWFGDYKVYSWGANVYEAPGKRAIRLQCNGNAPPLTATLSANSARGQAPLTSTLRVYANGGNGNAKQYRFRCKSFTGYSSWRSSSTYRCNYPTVGTFTASAQVRQSGSSTVTATTRVTVTTPPRPLAVSFNASPRSGYAPLVSWLTANTSGGNDRPREYRFRCKSFTQFSSWRRYNRYSCSYPRAGTYMATVEVRQSGSRTVSATVPITVYGSLAATLSASPSSGGAPMTSLVTVRARGGNGNAKQYRFRCSDRSAFTSWRTSSTYRCAYTQVGAHTVTAQVRQSGSSTVTATARITVTALCGNGRLEAGEQCDDGNTKSNDGCSASCKREIAVCGDRRIQAWAGEQCDDGNNDYTDGCTKYCKAAYCGDGYVRSGVEECDDGNRTSGDGCSRSCRVERISGACGAATATVSCGAPSGNLCASGVASAPAYNAATRKWEWTCGLGVFARTCTADKRCGYTEVQP